jgi:hypothetical protein
VESTGLQKPETRTPRLISDISGCNIMCDPLISSRLEKIKSLVTRVLRRFLFPSLSRLEVLDSSDGGGLTPPVLSRVEKFMSLIKGGVSGFLFPRVLRVGCCRRSGLEVRCLKTEPQTSINTPPFLPAAWYFSKLRQPSEADATKATDPSIKPLRRQEGK